MDGLSPILKGFYTPEQIRLALDKVRQMADDWTIPHSARTVKLIVGDCLKAAAEGKLDPSAPVQTDLYTYPPGGEGLTMDKVTVKITISRGRYEYAEDMTLDCTPEDVAETAKEALEDALRNVQRTMARCEVQDRVVDKLTRLNYVVSDNDTQFWSDDTLSEVEDWADLMLSGAPEEETEPKPRVVAFLKPQRPGRGG